VGRSGRFCRWPRISFFLPALSRWPGRGTTLPRGPVRYPAGLFSIFIIAVNLSLPLLFARKPYLPLPHALRSRSYAAQPLFKINAICAPELRGVTVIHSRRNAFAHDTVLNEPRNNNASLPNSLRALPQRHPPVNGDRHQRMDARTLPLRILHSMPGRLPFLDALPPHTLFTFLHCPAFLGPTHYHPA